MHVWICVANYVGGEDDNLEPIAVAAYSADEAARALDDLVLSLVDPRGWSKFRPYLQKVEGEVPQIEPAWKSDLFTDGERSTIYELTLEEVRDSVREYAVDVCDAMTLVECIATLDEDPDGVLELLTSLRDCKPILIEEGPNQFCKRFGLIDDSRLPVTPRGHEYLRLLNS